jgi:hypothetical protein
MASKGPFLPFRFRKPDTEAMARIGATLAGLETYTEGPDSLEKGRKPDATGSPEEVVAVLGEVLDADYRKGLLETENAPWTFEYVVQRDERDPRCLEILTRLYHPARAGSIFFGRRVRRIAPSEFAVWIDD